MLSFRTSPGRLASIPPLRPPGRPAPIRAFTHNTQLPLLASRHSQPRPQLPYLHQQPVVRRQTLLGPNQQIARLFSNETRRYVREQFWLATKWTLIIWTFGALSFVTYFGFTVETTERRSPTPPEWSFRTRYCLRGARELMDEEKQASMGQPVDWARVSSFAETVLQRCENPNVEGKDLLQLGQDGEQIDIPGVGKAGFDISAKSWPWRSAYCEAIIICALAAEHLDGKVLDTTNGVVYDAEFVVGPSNPDPRPQTHWMSRVPREEDVVPASAPPEAFYMRILTGRGFTTRQKMDAASAYANWLDFKGLPESAEEMHRWALDIAKSGLSTAVNPDNIIDSNTGILKQTDAAKDVSPNLLRAATEMAIHHARNNNVSAALPILLSVLRARRTALVSPFPPPASAPTTQSDDITSIISSLFRGSEFPAPPPSGDIPLVRSTDQPTCEDSELMLYIGEILYTTSSASDEGLGWTRQAVTIADGNLAMSHLPVAAGTDEAMERGKCKQCLLTGVALWDAMLARIMDKENSSVADQGRGWFGWTSGGKVNQQLNRLDDERKRLDMLKERIVQQGINQKLYGPS